MPALHTALIKKEHNYKHINTYAYQHACLHTNTDTSTCVHDNSPKPPPLTKTTTTHQNHHHSPKPPPLTKTTTTTSSIKYVLSFLISCFHSAGCLFLTLS
eukprot:scpid105578/ scgid5816/ 